MNQYHYRIVERDGYIHADWLFADNEADAWTKLAQTVARMLECRGMCIVTIHLSI